MPLPRKLKKANGIPKNDSTSFPSHTLPPPPLTPNTLSPSQRGLLSKQCRFCERKFSKAEHLKRHERSQLDTGERPYTCTRCQKSFSRSDVLIRHLKNHPQLSEHSEIEKDRRPKRDSTNRLKLYETIAPVAQNSCLSTAASVPQEISEYRQPPASELGFSQQFSNQTIENDETSTSQFQSGLDHLATLASWQEYGSANGGGSGSNPQDISHYEPADTGQATQQQHWNLDQDSAPPNCEIDPNLDPRLTQPETTLQPPDKTANNNLPHSIDSGTG